MYIPKQRYKPSLNYYDMYDCVNPSYQRILRSSTRWAEALMTSVTLLWEKNRSSHFLLRPVSMRSTYICIVGYSKYFEVNIIYVKFWS